MAKSVSQTLEFPAPNGDSQQQDCGRDERADVDLAVIAAPPGDASPVYRSLSAHQHTETSWLYHDLAVVALQWWDLFSVEFKLETRTTALRLEPHLYRLQHPPH